MNQILRGFKSEVNTLIDGLTFSNVDSVRNRMVRAFNSYNSLFKNEGVAISDDYLALKLDELNCWYEYQRSFPHTCGGDPELWDEVRDTEWLSPHMWG